MADHGSAGYNEISKGKTGLMDWFARNPRVGLAGSVASIISIPLSFWLTFSAAKERDVRFAVSPTQTTIVKAGESSDLHISYRQDELISDVSAVQIALWNNGTESIRKQNLLSTFITLHLEPHVKILEAKVRHSTRKLIDFTIDTSKYAQGSLLCSWNIMEHHDGVIIEIIYLGPPIANVSATGDIEGKFPIGEVLVGSNKANYVPSVRVIASLVVYFLLIATCLVIRGHRNVKKRRMRELEIYGPHYVSSISAYTDVLFLVVLLGLAPIMGGFVLYLYVLMPVPPFPF